MNQYVSDALLTWTHHIKSVCGNFETDFDGTRNLFIGEVQCFLLGDTEIAFIKNNANKIVRKADEIDRVNNRFCFLILQYSGKMLLEYKNETLSLNEGDIVLVDPVETISMYPQGLVSQISVHLSREKLLKENISTEYFGKLITQNMSGFLLKNILKNMSAENIKLWYATEDGNAFEDALIALIKPTINYKNINSSNKLMENAERYIIENLAKPDLTPKLIAEHIGVSLRHLYRLFLQENLSINKYIQLKRLEKVKADLLDKRNKQSSITQVALKWGFWDGAHFSKIFKKTYGISPVLADANIDEILPTLLQATFVHQGQVCASPERFFVHHTKHNELVEKLSKALSSLKIGSAMDEGSMFGPLSNQPHFHKVKHYLDMAKANNQIIAGGEALDRSGYFVQPTLISFKNTDDPLFSEETFGPVVGVMPFETDEELIQLMNQSRFGLTASIWTNDLSKALRLIPKIEAGTLWVNMHTFLDPSVPFGGVKASGIGREFSDAFIEDYTELKSVMIRY